jgi:hypothetical protein
MRQQKSHPQRRKFMSTLVLDKLVQDNDKKADLAGPGIGDYEVLERILPRGYRSLLTPKRDPAGHLPGKTLH